MRRNPLARLAAALALTLAIGACADADHPQEKAKRRPKSGEVVAPVDTADGSAPEESTPDTVSVAAAAPAAPMAP